MKTENTNIKAEDIEAIRKCIADGIDENGYLHMIFLPEETEILCRILDAAEKALPDEKKMSTDECRKTADLFNLICTSLPPVRSVNDTRLKSIRTAARLLEGYETDFCRFFERVERSDFLSGRKSGWRASFDWILKRGNLVKIAEGNYDNSAEAKDSKKESKGSFDTDEFFEAALRRSYNILEKMQKDKEKEQLRE